VRFLIVFGAGGLGSVARYLVGLWTADGAGEFPRGTLIVNVVGSFLIAIVLELALRKAWSPNVSLGLATGFMGGFTTYSAFNYQTTQLATTDGAIGKAALNVAVTLIACLAAGALGVVLARRIA
jgi:CrcB protein